MSDPRVDSCQHQTKTESGKIRCICPGRPYYFCKSNRRENVCPLGYSTTYDDPEIRPERPFESVLVNQIRRFHESHDTNRWNLKNRLDAFQLYYQLDCLQFGYFTLAMKLQRAGQHKRAHEAWGKHSAYRTAMIGIFPYIDGGGKALSDDYQKLQKEIAVLESAYENGDQP